MNHEFYSRVFELILRLKGNYLWPAMWNNAFNEDDPLDVKTADEWGIVMGNSDHEPMLRAQKEWTRHGTGPWDYSKNADVVPGRGLRFAMAFDDGPPQNTNRDWGATVKDSVRYAGFAKAGFTLPEPGYHTLKIWMVDPGIVLEKLVVDLGGVKPSYLGPPESFHGGF